jgi:hypothetical protein
MALQFRGLRSNDLTFLTSPYLGTQDIAGEDVVVSDRPRALALYAAMASDRMAQWARANLPSDPTPRPS